MSTTIDPLAAPLPRDQRCSACSQLFTRAEVTICIDGMVFCGGANCAGQHMVQTIGGPCYRGNTVVAEDTGNRAWNRYAYEHWYRDPDSGDWYEDRANAPIPTRLLDYHTNVLDRCHSPHELPCNDLIFGVELEMEPRCAEEEAQEEIVQRLNGPVNERFILTHDGSLAYGVEMVTVPLTLEEHKKDFDWEKTLAPVRSIAKSGSGTQNCGMHIHINRRALSPLTIGKMVVFLNHDRTDKLIRTVAQRGSNGFCDKKEVCRISDGRRRSENRYERLNLCNRGTVEMRIFKGNLRTERILKNIEFAHACVSFCKDASMADVTSPTQFCVYLAKHRGVYPNLVRFLQEQDWAAFKDAFKPNGVTHKSGAPELAEI